MPVLSTYHCDIPEVIKDGKSGFLVNEGDTDAMADKLKFLISNPELMKKMGIYGRKHIEKNYDIKKQIKQLEKIYQNVIKNNF